MKELFKNYEKQAGKTRKKHENLDKYSTKKLREIRYS